MPAQNNQKLVSGGIYSHIYNNAIESRDLFNDESDFDIFLNYLEDYLTPPPTPDKVKKTFSVNGQTFQGIPHQPQNYYNKIELVAYGLRKESFHLVINELKEGSVEKFVRSLCTRYAIYYNKKYQRKGSLFQGPYKSVQVNSSDLIYLTRNLHLECGERSSYKDYLGERVTTWVKSDAVFSYLENSEDYHFKGTKGYQNFVENYKPKEAEEVFKDLIPPEKAGYTEKAVLEPENIKEVNEQQIESNSLSKIKPFSFILASFVIFLILSGLGINNINTSVAQTKNQISVIPSPTPQVSGVETAIPTKTMVQIKIDDDSESVNLRLGPTTQSEIVSKAQEGEAFELISEEDGWYQIRLDDATQVFVSDRYAQIVEEEENL